MKLLSIQESPRKDKRFVAIFDTKSIHFGSKNGNTFLDHHDEKKRENYIKRHQVNEDWDSVNAGSLSRYLLWGDTDFSKNVKDYVKKFNL